MFALVGFILHDVEDSSATGVQHKGSKTDSAPGTGHTLSVQVLPLLPKQRNLTHPIFLNCIIVLITQTQCRRRYKQVSSPTPSPARTFNPAPPTNCPVPSLEKSSLPFAAGARRATGARWGRLLWDGTGAGPHITCTECLPAAIKSAFKERSQLSQHH